MPAITLTTERGLQKSVLRQANERLVLNTIRLNAGISRSELARITGLAPSSITFIVNRLTRAKLVAEESVEDHSRVGRRPVALRLVSDSMLAVGVDVTGTESRIALADASGNLLEVERVPWHANGAILAQRIHSATTAILRRSRSRTVLGVGVSLRGTIDRTEGRVIAAENLNWFNVEFGRHLRGRLTLPFYYENNAKASALAERWFATPGGKLLQNFVVVLPTDGLGTGIVVNGRLLRGTAGMAGEFGHIMLHPDGRKCVCGSQGCWEEYASDRALCRFYREETGARNGGPGEVSASAIVRMAREGDAAALHAIDKTVFELGLGFANLVSAFNPEALIVGGFVAEAWDLMEAPIWAVLRNRVPPYALAGLRMYPSLHAGNLSLLGAISLVYSRFFTRLEHGDSGIENGPVLIHTSD